MKTGMQSSTRGSVILGSAVTCVMAVITGTSHACHESPKHQWEAEERSTLLPLGG